MNHYIEIVNETTVVGVEEVVHIISEGLIGPPGPPGPIGPSGGSLFSADAAISLGGHRAVLLDANGDLTYASCSDLTHLGRMIGITYSAADQGQPAQVVSQGRMDEPSWNWNTSLPVYLSSNGTLTQVPPQAPAAKFSMVVGFPISSTALFVKLREPIVLTN